MATQLTVEQETGASLWPTQNASLSRSRLLNQYTEVGRDRESVEQKAYGLAPLCECRVLWERSRFLGLRSMAGTAAYVHLYTTVTPMHLGVGAVPDRRSNGFGVSDVVTQWRQCAEAQELAQNRFLSSLCSWVFLRNRSHTERYIYINTSVEWIRSLVRCLQTTLKWANLLKQETYICTLIYLK